MRDVNTANCQGYHFVSLYARHEDTQVIEYDRLGKENINAIEEAACKDAKEGDVIVNVKSTAESGIVCEKLQLPRREKILETKEWWDRVCV